MAINGATTLSCEICGNIRNLDRHHVIPRRMGGTKDPAIHDESNLMTLCRTCHRNLHEARWELVRTPVGIEVIDKETGDRVMRRVINPDLDVPALFQLLNLTEETLGRLHESLAFFTDDQLVAAYGYSSSFGKRSWLIQAAILYEAQRGILKKCVNSQAVYPLSEQHGLKARERRYTAHEEGKHWE